MLTSKLSSKGQVTIPKEIREELDLGAGDLVVYEVQDGVVTVRRAEPWDRAFHETLSETLDEWDSTADEVAFRDL